MSTMKYIILAALILQCLIATQYACFDCAECSFFYPMWDRERLLDFGLLVAGDDIEQDG